MQEYHAITPFEMEGLAASELRGLGFADVRPESGRAVFFGTPADALKANLWLRSAERVLLCVGRFQAESFDMLFDGVYALPWESYLPRDAAFPVTGKCARSRLMSVPDSQAIVKKAIVERLRSSLRVQALSETGATYAIDVHIHGDIATLTIDTSGASLARRGYRTYNGEAPLRETVAASLLLLSPWHTDQPLCDPMCGTGTIAIEAALMALDRAPGLNRGFDMEKWGIADAKAVKALRDEAQERFRRGAVCEIFASDIDPKAVALAKKHVVLAGIGNKIKIRRCSFDEVSGLPDRGAFVLNPPYGVRLMSEGEVGTLYARLGKWYAAYPYWSLTTITAHREFERRFGKRADKKRKLFNGKIECGAYFYWGERRINPEKERAREEE